MDLFSMEFFTALLSIVMIDIVLAGDNAVLIGLAARNLPQEQQKKVIWLGALGAIVIRSVATLLVVWLLKIPGLLLIGGIVLVWIAYSLLKNEEEEHDVESAPNLWAAVKTIIIADAAMGLDNVIAVAGAAEGHFLLVVIGLLISVPIVIWGSTIILKLMERFPVIIYIGAGILAWTASKMILHEPLVGDFIHHNIFIEYIFMAFIVVGVLTGGRMKIKSKRSENQNQEMVRDQ
ncbi:TerC family protein [Pseudalkalibacillus caeni]|uniref:TerC family protein n=1 Tax=Exobacillus caeni TaxID=2574798 RepID=A0A5R9F8B2_9BACL|nr:TerC family protein [Pseudalkalibacillus caeni]TLS38759.1 TerC family protein [Pseudalkalibacillus caeni]